EERRSLVERLVSSTLLALAAIVLLGAALAIGRFGSAIIGQEGAGGAAGVALAVERALLTGILLLGVGALVLRCAPAERRPVHWVSIGSLIVVGGWAVWSAAFAWYASSIADYQSIFGSLATVIVLMTYVHVSVITFLAGAQLDVMLEAEAEQR